MRGRAPHILSDVAMRWPLTTSASSEPSTCALTRPCTESYLNMYAMYAPLMKGSLMSVTSTSSRSRHTLRVPQDAARTRWVVRRTEDEAADACWYVAGICAAGL